MADHREAMKQGLAQLDSVKEMVAALALANEDGNDTARDEAERTIHEDALSVEVRSDWYTLEDHYKSLTNAKPAEYRILLCTGGPACQIVGKLNEYGEPETASMQVQDWGIPWMTMHLTRADEDTMLAYARCFYFGEG